MHEIAGRQTTAFSGAACEDVSFSYGEEPVLSRVSLHIPQGRVVGITGRSGSGKSTLLRLLMRFWDADGGAVRVSGRDVREVNTGDLRRMEGFVTQETHLFRDSIASNLRIAKRDATQAELEAACQRLRYTNLSCPCPRGMTRLWGSWEIRSPAGSGSGWGLPGRSCTTRRFCCWTSPPAIWIA